MAMDAPVHAALCDDFAAEELFDDSGCLDGKA